MLRLDNFAKLLPSPFHWDMVNLVDSCKDIFVWPYKICVHVLIRPRAVLT